MHEHISDRAVHDFASRNWLAAFIEHWIGGKPAKAQAVSTNQAADKPALRRAAFVFWWLASPVLALEAGA